VNKQQDRDKKYLALLLDAIRVCANYRPKLGHGGKAGYSLEEFQEMYRNDPFYSWVGLDNPLMYAAHKAAGGMTSVYRQIGIGCESLFRKVIEDSLGLCEGDVKWSYTVKKGRGKSRTLYLDARIPTEAVPDPKARSTRTLPTRQPRIPRAIFHARLSCRCRLMTTLRNDAELRNGSC
jgi:hypothetical protein